MLKITLLGAGSGFTQPLFTDILSIEGLDRGVIALVDIDEKRLKVNVALVKRLLGLMNKPKWRVEASTDRRNVLKGSDYVINTIEVSGTACVRHDNDIPLKYGIDQCIGDTIGPGGVMKALRTLPVFLQILDDIARYCPQALIMNYTNPMSIMTLASIRCTAQPFIGLCHSVQGTSRHLAKIAGVPYDEVKWRCGGINHLAWFTEFSHNGRDLYPVLRKAMENPQTYELDPVRFEIMKQFGYFVTESSGHFSEYVPYFRKRPELIKQFCREGYLGGSSFYADCWPKWRKNTDRDRRLAAAGKKEIGLARSYEYASDIIEAHCFDRAKIVYGSVENTGLIPNLPQTGVVETAVLVNKEGFRPTYFGNLPEQLAALCRAHMPVYELCAQGILDQDREAVIHAMMLDPLSAAVCAPHEIRAMAEDLFRAERKYIPSWCARDTSVAGGIPRRRKRPAKRTAARPSTMAAKIVRE